MEALVLALIVAGYVDLGTSVAGPHQPAPETCKKVAITSDRTGEVLYYNCR